MSGHASLGNIAIITARGGSKRIPKKNIKPFCGRPIIEYSIDAALESGLFETVMVSTDDREIAELSRACGAEVPFMRSEKTSDDYSTTADVLMEVLGAYREIGRRFDVMCCIYPTAPFVTPEKLRKAYDMLDGARSVLCVTEFSFPPQRGLVQSGDAFEYWMPECANERSQDLRTIYHDVGQFYFCRAQDFLEDGILVGPGSRGFKVSRMEAQDIDDLEDWQLAELKYERMIA